MHKGTKYEIHPRTTNWLRNRFSWTYVETCVTVTGGNEQWGREEVMQGCLTDAFGIFSPPALLRVTVHLALSPAAVWNTYSCLSVLQWVWELTTRAHTTWKLNTFEMIQVIFFWTSRTYGIAVHVRNVVESLPTFLNPGGRGSFQTVVIMQME